FSLRLTPRPLLPALFPYPTLFRSAVALERLRANSLQRRAEQFHPGARRYRHGRRSLVRRVAVRGGDPAATVVGLVRLAVGRLQGRPCVTPVHETTPALADR